MSAQLGGILEFTEEGSQWIERIGDQHLSLRGAAQSLDALLGSVIDAGHGGDATAARGGLADFHRQLLEHLRCEEREARLALAIARAPHWHRRADLLQGDHSRFRASVAVLVADAERAYPEPDWSSIHQRFAAFVRAFAAHEALENEILQRAYLEDMGGED